MCVQVRHDIAPQGRSLKEILGGCNSVLYKAQPIREQEAYQHSLVSASSVQGFYASTLVTWADTQVVFLCTLPTIKQFDHKEKGTVA